MSKAALYKGLGVGLMSFGDNLSQQMAQSAEQRRQESLLALKRQWQLQDRADEREWQTGLLDREIERQDAMTADERAYQAQVRAEERANEISDRDYISPADQALVDQRTASANAQRALAESRRSGGGDSILGNFQINPERYTPESLLDAREIEAQGGSDREVMGALVEAPSGSMMQGAPQIDREAIIQSAEDFVSGGEFYPDQFPGITEDSPYEEKVMAVAESMLRSRTNFMSSPEMGGGGQQIDPQQVLSEAEAAISRGADPEQVARRMAEIGLPQDQVDMFLIQHSPAHARAARTLERRQQ